MNKENKCPICTSAAALSEQDEEKNFFIICPRCGEFEIQGKIANILTNWSQLERTNISGWIREHQGIKLTSDDIKKLKKLETPTLSQKANKLLFYLAETFIEPGEDIELIERILSKEKIDTYLGVAWVQSKNDLKFLIEDYLCRAKNFLCLIDKHILRISPEGWAYLYHIERLKNFQWEMSDASLFAEEKFKILKAAKIKKPLDS